MTTLALVGFQASPEALDPRPPLLLGETLFLGLAGGLGGAPGLLRLERPGDERLKPLQRGVLVPRLAPMALARDAEDPGWTQARSQRFPDPRALLGRERSALVQIPARLDL